MKHNDFLNELKLGLQQSLTNKYIKEAFKLKGIDLEKSITYINSLLKDSEYNDEIPYDETYIQGWVDGYLTALAVKLNT